MIYEATFAKKNTYWWDEDKVGKCQFAATSDEEARMFLSIVITRVNRTYDRMKEPREVSITNLVQLLERATLFSIKRRQVEVMVPTTHPYRRNIRTILEAFYPKHSSGPRGCIANLFTDWRPTPCRK